MNASLDAYEAYKTYIKDNPSATETEAARAFVRAFDLGAKSNLFCAVCGGVIDESRMSYAEVLERAKKHEQQMGQTIHRHG